MTFYYIDTADFFANWSIIPTGLINDSIDANAITPGFISSSISSSCGIGNEYIQRQYPTDLTVAPDSVKQMVSHLVDKRLFDKIGYKIDGDIDKLIIYNFENATKYFELIRDDMVSLDKVVKVRDFPLVDSVTPRRNWSF